MNAQFLALLICLLPVRSLLAQGVPSSSDPTVLESASRQTKNDSSRYAILLHLGQTYRKNNPEKAKNYIYKIPDESKVKGFESIRAKAFELLTVIAIQEAKFDSLEFYSSKALDFANQSGDTGTIIQSIRCRAAALMTLKRPVEGSHLLMQSVSMARQTADTAQLVSNLMLLANLKGRIGQHKELIDLIEEEEKYWIHGRPIQKSYFQYFRARANAELGYHHKAISDYRKAHPVFKQQSNFKSYTKFLHWYSQSFRELNQIDSALYLSSESLNILRNSQDSGALGEALLLRASIYYSFNNLDSAKIYSQLAQRKLAPLNYSRNYIEVIKLLADIEADMGNWKQSKLLTDRYIDIKDSISRRERVASLDSLLLIHEVSEKEAALKTAEQENLIQKLKWQRTFSLFSALALIILTFLGVFVYRKRRQLKALAKERDQKEKELSSARKELRLKLEEVSNYQGSILELEDKLRTLKSQKLPIEKKLKSADIFNILKRNIKEESDWGLFEEYFSQANPTFLRSLQEKHPQLTAHDLRLVSLLRLNLNSNEIAVLFNIAPDSVRKSRYRLAKKLDLKGEKDLYPYLAGVVM